VRSQRGEEKKEGHERGGGESNPRSNDQGTLVNSPPEREKKGGKRGKKTKLSPRGLVDVVIKNVDSGPESTEAVRRGEREKGGQSWENSEQESTAVRLRREEAKNRIKKKEQR